MESLLLGSAARIGRLFHVPERSGLHALMLVLGFVFRLLNAFVDTAFFQPDEFFQAWEPAYLDVYGVGFLTWEWQAAIRSSLVPRFFALVLRAARALHIDHLVLGKVVMAAVASISDLYTALLAERIVARKTNSAFPASVWLISLGSMFNWYCSTRPFSNTFEMVLATIALYHGLSDSTAGWIVSQVLAHVTIALRPSNAILWLFIGCRRLVIQSSRSLKRGFSLALVSGIVGITAQGIVLWLDVRYYGRMVVPYIEFVRHNFGSRVSEIYGIQPWHWYVSQALPFLLLGNLPLILLGLRRAPALILQIVGINVAAFSMIAHKEFRFVYFLLPLLHIVVALGSERARTLRIGPSLRIGALLVNVVAGVYFGSFHQRGVVDVVEYVRRTPTIQDVSFLMPCHSTPWHSHFQRPHDPKFLPQFLTCDPPWNISSAGYVDEADRFYADPERFLAENPTRLASTLVVFEALKPTIEGLGLGYAVNTSFSNGLFNEDARRQGRVLVMTKNVM